MSITYAPDPSPLAELAIGIETTYGTLFTPTVQVATSVPPEFGRGHTPIQGAAMTSTIQSVLNHRVIRGLEIPYVNFDVPLSANSISTLFHMVWGSALASNEWLLSAAPPGFTVGVHSQRPGATAGDYFKFLGTRVARAVLRMPLGGEARLRLECIARQMLDPDTSPTSFPALSPTTTYRPFILTDSSLKHAATAGGATGATAVKIKGFELAIDMGLLVEHNSNAAHPDHIIRTAFDATGTIDARFGADWWDEWKAIVAGESSGGLVTVYNQFLLNDGTNTLRMLCPSKVDLAGIRPDGLAYDASLAFIAAGDDTAGTGGAPTTATIKVTNV